MNGGSEDLGILLLAGGKSSRMGKDKATLEYNGKSQLERMHGLVLPLDFPVHLSVRKGQETTLAKVETIPDADGVEGSGPMAGMLSAFTLYPQRAFLVIACDLPFLDIGTLSYLLMNRATDKIATAYRSAHGGLPEPLCAIWEPHAMNILEAKFAEGMRCPRKILIQENAHLIDLPNPVALDNINTPEEYEAALARLET